jgi:putative ABC transport system ATP-binding protein
MAIISVKNLIKSYQNGELETKVLRGLSIDIMPGEFVAVMGKSGAGKSTLLYQISLLDIPTSGEISVNGVDILALSEEERTDFRLKYLGYIFQDYALVPELSALENVIIPLLMEGVGEHEAKERGLASLEELGLAGKANNRPNQLSGGEQQRVSIARAIVQNPTILFADEPTANLDSASSEAVIESLKKLHDKGQTIVMVTHEEEYTRVCDKVIYLIDGQIAEEKIQKKTTS